MPRKYDGPKQTGFYPVRKRRVFISGLKHAAAAGVGMLVWIIVMPHEFGAISIHLPASGKVPLA